MSRHLFFASNSSKPSSRWQEAFPDGACVDGVGAVQATDLVWIDTADESWERTLQHLAGAPLSCAVVLVSSAPDDEEALRGLERGARGYCHAYAVPALLREVAQVVERGGLWIGPGLLERFIAALRPRLPAAPRDLGGLLSQREREVGKAVAAGRSNKEIAAQLGISERTVKAHLGSIFEKLDVRDRLQLALLLSDDRAPQHGGGQ